MGKRAVVAWIFIGAFLVGVAALSRIRDDKTAMHLLPPVAEPENHVAFVRAVPVSDEGPTPSAIGCLSGSPKRCLGQQWQCQNTQTGQWFTLAVCVPPKTCHVATGCQ